MRKAKVYNFGNPAGELIEIEQGKRYKFITFEDYTGSPVSLTMPVKRKRI